LLTERSPSRNTIKHVPVSSVPRRPCISHANA
jgi:hypothetical protein